MQALKSSRKHYTTVGRLRSLAVSARRADQLWRFLSYLVGKPHGGGDLRLICKDSRRAVNNDTSGVSLLNPVGSGTYVFSVEGRYGSNVCTPAELAPRDTMTVSFIR